MKSFQPSAADLARLQAAARNISQGNAKATEGEKQSKAGKAVLTDWLMQNRNFDVAAMKPGEFVEIEGVAVIEGGSRPQWDSAAFAAAHPDLVEKFTKTGVPKTFKPQAAALAA